MKPSKEPEGEETKPTAIASYNSEIDAIREKEFSILEGRLLQVQLLWLGDSRLLQE